MKGTLNIFPSPDDLVAGTAEKIIACLSEAVELEGSASLVVSGGVTPRSVYELLGSEGYRGRIVWEKVHLFWGDERCVLPTMPESNFRMVQDSLIQYIAIPQENVHRVQAEHPPREAARLYESEIRTIFPLAGGLPRFTVVLLGLGEDGHTASLFQGSAALREKEKLVTELYVESLRAHRVTLTLPPINNALNIIFIVSGERKAEILHNLLEVPGLLYPTTMIAPTNGGLFWFVDRDAASRLESLS